MEALGNIWIGCGCLFLLGIVVVALLAGVSRGGETAIVSVLLLLGIVGYLAWARQSNQPRR